MKALSNKHLIAKMINDGYSLDQLVDYFQLLGDDALILALNMQATARRERISDHEAVLRINAAIEGGQ